MLRSFRSRLATTIVLLVALTALAVGVVSLVLVERSLRAQLVDDAVAQAQFNVGVLASDDVMPVGSGRPGFEASGLAERFQLRGSDGVYVEFDDDPDAFASSLSLLDAGEALPSALRDLVAAGRAATAFIDVGGEPFAVVGARRPPQGPDFYFFVSATEVDDAVARLATVLLGAGVAVVVVAALAAGLVSRRVLRPVGRASGAAAAMADGDLSVRLPSGGGDEFAAWAESFNTMATSLEAKVSELQAAQDRERRFVADVSHELRTPLTALVAEAEMARALLADGPPHGARIGELLTADIGRMRHLVEDLLEISRLDADAPPVRSTPVDLREFLRAVIADRHPDAVLEIGPLRVACDRLALERIVANLLDNARRHAPGAGVTVRGDVDGQTLWLEVADDGPGVAEGDLERMFDRFATGDRSRHGGSGLGLAIARRHAMRMGGSLVAVRNRPHGLVFRLDVPVTDLLHDRDGTEKGDADTDGETFTESRSVT